MTITKSAIIDYLYKPTEIPKQRMVEWFTGKQLDETTKWSYDDGFGTNSVFMNDEVDGGLIFDLPLINNQNSITCGNIKQFDPLHFLWVSVERILDDNAILWGGIIPDGVGPSGQNWIDVHNTRFNSPKLPKLDTGSGSSSGATDASQFPGGRGDWAAFILQGDPTAPTMKINGVLEVTHTEDLPTFTPGQAFYRASNRSTATAKQCEVRYLEVYNI